MLKQKVELKNKLGLHARAAAKFVAHAARYVSEITVIKNEKRVNGKSIMGVMMLAASKGTVLEFEIIGEDAEAMLEDLKTLIEMRFDEPE